MKRVTQKYCKLSHPMQYLFDRFAFLHDSCHLKLLSADCVVGSILRLQESEHVFLLLLARWNGTGPGCFLFANF